MPSIVSFGYNQSLLGGVLTLDSFQEQFNDIDATTTTVSEQAQKSTVRGMIVALYAVGGLFGALSCIGLGDLLGRRRVILPAAFMQMVGAIFMASSFDLFLDLVAAVWSLLYRFGNLRYRRLKGEVHMWRRLAYSLEQVHR